MSVVRSVLAARGRGSGPGRRRPDDPRPRVPTGAQCAEQGLGLGQRARGRSSRASASRHAWYCRTAAAKVAPLAVMTDQGAMGFLMRRVEAEQRLGQALQPLAVAYRDTAPEPALDGVADQGAQPGPLDRQPFVERRVAHRQLLEEIALVERRHFLEIAAQRGARQALHLQGIDRSARTSSVTRNRSASSSVSPAAANARRVSLMHWRRLVLASALSLQSSPDSRPRSAAPPGASARCAIMARALTLRGDASAPVGVPSRNRRAGRRWAAGRGASFIPFSCPRAIDRTVAGAHNNRGRDGEQRLPAGAPDRPAFWRDSSRETARARNNFGASEEPRRARRVATRSSSAGTRGRGPSGCPAAEQAGLAGEQVR